MRMSSSVDGHGDDEVEIDVDEGDEHRIFHECDDDNVSL